MCFIDYVLVAFRWNVAAGELVETETTITNHAVDHVDRSSVTPLALLRLEWMQRQSLSPGDLGN